MTDNERIEAIGARLVAATPGPWVTIHQEPTDNGIDIATGRGSGRAFANVLGRFSSQRDRIEANAALIAHAPADLAWLIEKYNELWVERECLIHGTP